MRRGKCPVCKRDFSLKQSGRLRQHVDAKGYYCRGSDLEVKPLKNTFKCHCARPAAFEVFINGGKGNKLCGDDALELVAELIKGKGGNGQIILMPID